MSEPVKEKININLEKAKEEGKYRVDNIREIVRDAVSQAASELKEGTGEIGSIIKTAVSNAIADLKQRGRRDPDEISASITGAIEGSTEQKQQEIDQHRARLQQLQLQIDEQQRQLDNEINGVLVDIHNEDTPEDGMKLAVSQAIGNVMDEQQSGVLQQQYLKLKAQLATLDEKLQDRYGNRYVEVKDQWENAKVWYKNTKAEADANGTIPLHEKESKIEGNLGNLGETVARKEHEVKEQLTDIIQDFWQAKGLGNRSKR